MFNKILSKIVTRQTAPAPSAAAHNSAQQLMEDAERFAGRTPRYASDLRRAAQAQLMLNSYFV